MLHLVDLSRAMLVGMIVMQSVWSSVVDVPLTKVGNNYALNFTIDGGVYNNIVSVPVSFPRNVIWHHDSCLFWWWWWWCPL
jgi:hypothetical protein